MGKVDSELDRLLRAAARAEENRPAEVPYGFDTRVVARWRAERSGGDADAWNVAAMFRRVTIGALIIAACAGAGAFWQLKENDNLDVSTEDAYALADSVIETGTW